MEACMHACPSENRSYHLREIVRERACLVRISVNLHVRMRSNLFVQRRGKSCTFFPSNDMRDS